MAGLKTTGASPSYGTKGQMSTNTFPGALRFATIWYDLARQTLWIFGGTSGGNYSLQFKYNMQDLQIYCGKIQEPDGAG